MLAGDFYTYIINEKKEGVIVATITFNRLHPIFEGHFPQIAVVPGVCQVQIIKEIIIKELNTDFQLSSAREIKFLSLINPDNTAELNLTINYEYTDSDNLKVGAQFTLGETMFLKFKAEYIKKKKASEQCIKNGECCVIIPTYNNSNTLKKVIEDVKAFTSHIIVVNDGSTDNTSEILKTIINIKVITHQKNKGKGGALRTGFAEALKSGFKYAITIDSDGQHLAKDIPLFYDVISNNPGSLIIGSRLLIQENMPGKNTFANKFSNFWFRLQTGINLKDTQSGFRLYPLLDIDKMKLFSAKYEYELEILVRAAWRNINIIAIPIDVYYPPKEERITHFRPLRDFTRISVLNTIFTFLAIIYYRPALFFKKIKNKTNKTK